ncbi:hypothetical protein PTKIN_Ptkin14bG0125400 [Pterospermum kingtungense]
MAKPRGHQNTSSKKACTSFRDKISNLPVDLILKILYFLSSKQVVQTSVLSKRWVLLWTLVPSLNLQDNNGGRFDKQARRKFVHFVDRVLFLKKSASVEKFSLNCQPIYGQSCINKWICTAMEQGLQEVDISVTEISKEYLVKLPCGLFLMKTLKILKLHRGIMVDVPVSVCLPSLKILHLLLVKYASAESISCFVSGCPSLEELHIDVRISPVNMMNLNISIPTLITLYLSLQYAFEKEPHAENFEINASALKNLIYLIYIIYTSSVSMHKQYFVENFPCIREANICVPEFYRTEILKAVSGVECLTLTWKQDFFDLVLEYNFCPLFANLTRLELRGVMNWRLLLLFLENSPKLETLVADYKIFRRDGRPRWRELKPVKCFLSSLSRVCFEDFIGLEEQVNMVEYFLMNARVLRIMEIYSRSELSSKSKHCFIKKLSKVPRSSETCQLSFK